MQAYYYPFWKRQYFFHPQALQHDGLMRLYHPYNKIAKVIWAIWKRAMFVRKLFTIDYANSVPFRQMLEAIPELKNSIWVINTGSRSGEPKTTGLVTPLGGSSDFFFKIGTTDRAKEVIVRESCVYKLLRHSGLVPGLLSSGLTAEYAYYITEVVDGSKLTSPAITEKISDIIKYINSIPGGSFPAYSENKLLQMVFCHGDFAPWNIIQQEDGQLKVIDWEYAGIYPLGFDLFYFIFQVSFLLSKQVTASSVLLGHEKLLNNFFVFHNIPDWQCYLVEFCDICIKRYPNTYIGKRYEKLKEITIT